MSLAAQARASKSVNRTRQVSDAAALPLAEALSLLDAGVGVIPIRRDGSKAPAVTSWKPYEDRLATVAEARLWWDKPEPPGVATIGGKVSGNLLHFDFDEDAEATFRAWCEIVALEAADLLPKLSQVRTPRLSLGYHLRFRVDGVPVGGNQKLALDETGKVLIETRGEGGYALAPGSPGCCHETGREYEHVAGPPLGSLVTITASEFEILMRAARSLDRSPQEGPRAESVFNLGVAGAVRPGDDFNQRGPDWSEILVGWTQARVAGKAIYWRRPGKAAGWSATTGFCTSKASRVELFAVFSQNAAPFPGPSAGRNCSAHSRFDAYTLLHHAGDHSAAAKALAAQGYGSAAKKNETTTTETPITADIELLTLGQLTDTHKEMREPIIEGLLRRGEVMNVVSTTKRGKSFLVAGLGLTVASGGKWLDSFQTKPGRVLFIDNELHPETLAVRLKKVAEELPGVQLEAVRDNVGVIPLRGKLKTLPAISRWLRERYQKRHFQLIIIDAFYRMFDDERGENSNTAVTQFYNELDALAADLDCCIVVVHHGSKGNQSEKSVTDVGAGAGSQSRATDAHLILREHEAEDVSVLEAALRSFPPLEPICVRWEHPIWKLDIGLDPTKLKRAPADQRHDRQRADSDVRLLDALERLDPNRRGVSIAAAATEAGMGKETADRAVARLALSGMVQRRPVDVPAGKGATKKGVDGVRRIIRDEAIF
jgi:hypothetical protein